MISMPSVADYIDDSYGVKKFLGLSSKEQNSLLYAKFPGAKGSNIRQQKSKYLSKLLDNNAKTDNKKQPKIEQKTKSDKPTNHSNVPPGGGVPAQTLPPLNLKDIPADIKMISQYMRYFDYMKINVKFNEVLSYLDKTNQLAEQGGSELAQQLTTEQLLAVIKPSESLLPENSPSINTLLGSTSLTNQTKSK